MRTHFEYDQPAVTIGGEHLPACARAACGANTKRVTRDVWRTDCAQCQCTNVYVRAVRAAEQASEPPTPPTTSGKDKP